MELDLVPSCEYESLVSGVQQNVVKFIESELSYSEFYWKYMQSNWPVIITNVAKEWECRQSWIIDNNSDVETKTSSNANTNIDFNYLRHKISNRRVPVANCSNENHAKAEMDFHEFLHRWETNSESQPLETNCNYEESTQFTKQNLYLKDWHLKTQNPEYDFYRVPKHFASDWLNEHLIYKERDDYRFVYMGPKDSWTPFHSDVFGSYSWSTNITGCKKWILLPPGEELKLSDRLGNLPFCVNESQLDENGVQFFTIYQNENEAIFVPSSWYHQVWNLTDTISINHNWFNACNVQLIWRNLSLNLQKVVKEIDDCRQMEDFDDHCQIMLRANFGINYADFLELLEFIAERRMNLYNDVWDQKTCHVTIKPFRGNESFLINKYQLIHDLQNINIVLKNMTKDHIISRSHLLRRCVRLIELTDKFSR